MVFESKLLPSERVMKDEEAYPELESDGCPKMVRPAEFGTGK